MTSKHFLTKECIPIPFVNGEYSLSSIEFNAIDLSVVLDSFVENRTIKVIFANIFACRVTLEHFRCSSMTSDDVSRTIDKAIEKAGVTFQNHPCLLSDNGPCYIASSLKEYLCKEYNIKHIHGRPLHPQTQGKIERYHRSMKNVIKLNHYFCPSELENAIDGWVKYYNERRFHESLDNLTPKDVYLGQGEKIKKIREIIKQNSINKRIFNNKTMKYHSN